MKLPIALLLLAGLPVLAADKVEKGFKSLFNGKDMTGWEAPENPQTFSLRDGAIVANGNRSHLYYVGPVNGANFKNFELKVDVMTKPNSNGGIYFHTAKQEKGWPSKGFEVQVNNSYAKDWRKTGGIYSVQDVKEPPAQDDQWFTEHIIVKDKQVTVKINDKTVAEWTEPEGYKHPEFADRKLSSGTFALQGHDPGSTVYYKNIRVKVLK